MQEPKLQEKQTHQDMAIAFKAKQILKKNTETIIPQIFLRSLGLKRFLCYLWLMAKLNISRGIN